MIKDLKATCVGRPGSKWQRDTGCRGFEGEQGGLWPELTARWGRAQTKAGWGPLEGLRRHRPDLPIIVYLSSLSHWTGSFTKGGALPYFRLNSQQSLLRANHQSGLVRQQSRGLR